MYINMGRVGEWFLVIFGISDNVNYVVKFFIGWDFIGGIISVSM